MKQPFRERLLEFNDLIKSKFELKEKEAGKPGEKEEQLAKLDQELAARVESYAVASRTDAATQQKILSLQEDKRRIMNKLNERLLKLDSPEYHPQPRKEQRVVYGEGNEMFLLQDGKKSKISLGEILTDHEWGIEYFLSRDNGISRQVRKKYLITATRAEMQNLLDKQIAQNEAHSDFNDTYFQQAYQGVLKDLHKKVEWLQSGKIAEKMIKNFLQKIAIDCGVDFEIVQTDVYQDVQKKIDFIIKRKVHQRGVKVEAKKGVQFTTNIDPVVQEKKQRQISNSVAKGRIQQEDKIDDIVLVTIPLNDVKGMFNDWTTRGLPPGGPDKLWPLETKQKVFYGVLAGMFEKTEIDEMWANYSNSGKE